MNKQNNRCTIVLQNFQQSRHPRTDATYDNLLLMLSRSTVEAISGSPMHYHWVSELLGLTIDQASFPQAAIELYDNNKTGDNLWTTIVSPVLLVPNREHLAMVQAKDFHISQDEVAAFCRELNLHFQEEKLKFLGEQSERWYCFSESPFAVTQVPPTTILGENIFPYIPQDDNRHGWQKIFNDCQMLLHHSACNQQRISSGKPEINSLWFWGGGVLPESYQASVGQVISNDICVNNMAKLGGAESLLLELEHFPQVFTVNAGSLIVIDMQQLTNQQIKSLDQTVFALLKKTVLDSMTEELQIAIDGRCSFFVNRKSLKQFWRRKKSFADFGI